MNTQSGLNLAPDQNNTINSKQMQATIKHQQLSKEFFIDENCWITELSNSSDDSAVSIAQARVLPNEKTRWHRVNNTVERYYIQSGIGLVEVGTLPATKVSAGDVVIIPADCPQRITNIGVADLVFLAICSPRFSQDNYEDIESEMLNKNLG